MDFVSCQREPARNLPAIIADTPTVGRKFTSNDYPSQRRRPRITFGHSETSEITIAIMPPTVEGGLPGPVRSSWSSRIV
jgi:hypothetical protein